MILRTLFTAGEIESAVARLAVEITHDHAGDLSRLAGSGNPPADDDSGSGRRADGRGRRTARAGQSRRTSTPGGPATRAGARGAAGASSPLVSLALPAAAGVEPGSRAEVRSSLSIERPVLVGVLKGTFVLVADLARAMKIPTDVDFVRVRLGGGELHPDRLEFAYEPEHSLAGRSVVVVEDVAGTGRTLGAVLARLQAHEPSSLRVCALVRRRGYSGPPVDYVGFDVGPGWLVGYGLDDREAFRNLPGLCLLED